MHIFQSAILTHGGAGSNPQDSDGPQSAAKAGMDLMGNGKSALNAVIQAVGYLEDNPRFNAGIGSQLRADGRTVQLDASCMMSNGKYGAVACVEGIQNPVDLAQRVLLHSPHILIVGEGARIFAEEQNMSSSEAAQRAMTLFDASIDVGLIILTKTEFASNARNGMAWSHLTEIR